MATEGIDPKKFENVNFNIVMEVGDKITNNDYIGGCASMNDPWLKEAALHVRQEVFKRGCTVPELGPAPCAVDIDDAFTVHYNGDIYKCVTLVGHEQFKVGEVSQGIDMGFKRPAAPYFLDHWQSEEKCRECPYLPMCFGGCRYMAYQRDGDMARVDCKKDFLDAALKEMLLQELKYRYGQD